MSGGFGEIRKLCSEWAGAFAQKEKTASVGLGLVHFVAYAGISV